MNPGDPKGARSSISSRGRQIKMPQHLRDFEISRSGQEDVDLERTTRVTTTPEVGDGDGCRVAVAALPRLPVSRPRDSSASPEGAHTRPPHLGLPTCLRLAQSSLRDRVGVFAAAPLPVGLRLGPYEGRPVRADGAGAGQYSWRVRHGRLVDSGDKARSNWMRFVNCVSDADGRNLAGFQHHGTLYFCTVAPVAVGAELFVYYGDDYASSVDADGYYDYIPSKEESDSEFAATDDGGGDGDAGDDDVHIGIDDYCDYRPPKEEPEPELGDGEAGDDYGPPDVDNYGLFEEDPETKIDIHYHPLKEEPEPELGGGDGDAVGVNGCYDCDLVKKEPETELTTTGDDAGTDSGRVVGYDCSHCRICQVEHDLRCKVRVEQKELESQVTKLYHCGYCTYPFQNKELKEQHQRYCPKKPGVVRRRSNGTYFQCDKCEYVAKSKGNFETHVLSHSNNVEWLTCTLCSYKTAHKSVMIRHMKIHGITFNLSCPICGKSFKTKLYVDEHLLRHHSDEWDEVSTPTMSKIYTCNICKKYRTVMKNYFNIHLIVKHLKGQKYDCPRCPYSTFYKQHLRRHSKKHAKQTDHQCAACKKQFSQKRELYSHILHSHADNVDLVKTITYKIHLCELCSFKTLHRPNLKKHVRSNHF